MTGIEIIAKERKRQIDEEGWTPEHDDEHYGQELAYAASEYINEGIARQGPRSGRRCTKPGRPRNDWPWAWMWWKPSEDPIRNLAKAGALIAAEIDRLERTRTENYQDK